MVSRLEQPVVRVEAECVLREIEMLVAIARKELPVHNAEAVAVLAQRMTVQARVLRRLCECEDPRP